jgi:hypothetical protein
MANAAVTWKFDKQTCHVATQAFVLAWLGEFCRPPTQEILGLVGDWNGSHGGKLVGRTDNFGPAGQSPRGELWTRRQPASS